MKPAHTMAKGGQSSANSKLRTRARWPRIRPSSAGASSSLLCGSGYPPKAECRLHGSRVVAAGCSDITAEHYRYVHYVLRATCTGIGTAARSSWHLAEVVTHVVTCVTNLSYCQGYSNSGRLDQALHFERRCAGPGCGTCVEYEYSQVPVPIPIHRYHR